MITPNTIKKKDLYNSTNEIQENLLYWYSGHSAWYELEHDVLNQYSLIFDLPLTKVCGMCSALSPRIKWQSNKKLLVKVLQMLKLGYTDKEIIKKSSQFGRNTQKAINIYRGTGKVHDIFTILNSNKTQNFFMNLLYPYDEEFLTLDVWMFKAMGLNTTSVSKNQYKFLHEIFNATFKGELPCSVQANIWENVKAK